MTIDWQKLYFQGRVKDIGVAWNEEELDAIYRLRIPVVYVRDGILTTKEYEAARAADVKNGVPVSRMNRAELFAAVAEVDPDRSYGADVPDSVLRDIIARKGGKTFGGRKAAAPRKSAEKKSGSRKVAGAASKKTAKKAAKSKAKNEGNDTK